MDQRTLDRAYVAAKARGRAGQLSRKSLRRAAVRLGLCYVADTFISTEDPSRGRLCAKHGHPVERLGGWWVHRAE